MTGELERRLALQAARGIAALELAGRIKDLSVIAQVQRDEARIRFDRSMELTNDTFARAVIAAYNDYERQVDSLRDTDDDDDDDNDD